MDIGPLEGMGFMSRNYNDWGLLQRLEIYYYDHKIVFPHSTSFSGRKKPKGIILTFIRSASERLPADSHGSNQIMLKHHFSRQIPPVPEFELLQQVLGCCHRPTYLIR